MSGNLQEASAGTFATARARGLTTGEIDFINQKAFQRVPVAHVANMLSRPLEDVSRWYLPPTPDVEEEEEAEPPTGPRVVLSLWRGLITIDAPPTTKREIALRVCRRNGMSLAELVGPRRFRQFARPRQEAMYLMVKTERWSLPSIGRFMNRDHTTVLHGYRAHAKRWDLPL